MRKSDHSEEPSELLKNSKLSVKLSKMKIEEEGPQILSKPRNLNKTSAFASDGSQPLDAINEKLSKLTKNQKKALNQTNQTNSTLDQTFANLNQTVLEESKFQISEHSQKWEQSDSKLPDKDFVKERHYQASCASFKVTEAQNIEKIELPEQSLEFSEISSKLKQSEEVHFDYEEEAEEGSEENLDQMKQAAYTEFDNPQRVLDALVGPQDEADMVSTKETIHFTEIQANQIEIPEYCYEDDQLEILDFEIEFE